MFIDLSPLYKHRDYRLIFFAQAVSYLGSMVSYVAVPYQIYQLTNSTLIVGALSATQLVPVFIFSLFGGSVADRIDRRRLLIISESIMCICGLGLVLNASMNSPNVPAIFVLVFILQAATSYHRPAMEAMTQKMIPPEDFPTVSALASFKYGVTAIAGPALGGWIIFKFGIVNAYIFDFATFFVSLIAAFFLSQSYKAEDTGVKTSFTKDIKEGLNFARKNQTILGSYFIDIVAMIAFPVALFPAMVKESGNETFLGWLYAAMAIGTLLVTLCGNLFTRYLFRGRAIVVSAALWGVAIFFSGLWQNMYIIIFFLVLAGAADTVSGLHRRIVWNEIIPNHMRGRLAGLEMISYLSGPLIGNFRAGTQASVTSLSFTIASGGVACVLLIVICAMKLPLFWKYKSTAETLKS